MSKSKTSLKRDESGEYVLVNLPNAHAVLVLGSLSILSCFLIGFPGVVLGFIGIRFYKKPHELYQLAPELYRKESYKDLRAGYFMSIIGLTISSLFLLFLLFFVIVFGAPFAVF